MRKTILYALFLLLVTDMLFTACIREDPESAREVGVELDLKIGKQAVSIENSMVEDVFAEQTVIVEEEKVEEVVMEEEVAMEVKEEEMLEEELAEEAAIEEEVEEEMLPIGTSDYDDGTYSMSGSYRSPAGSETIGVTLTLEDDTIAAVSIQKNAVNETSVNYQSLFAEGISSLVVGKTLDEIGTFSSVNGSSLTPKAFQEALELIKAEAKN